MYHNTRLKRAIEVGLVLLGIAGKSFGSEILIIPDSPHVDTVGYDNCDMLTNGELMVIRDAVPPMGVIFDVGANVGEWSKHVLLFHPKTSIFAFEPIPNFCEKLRKELCPERVKVFPLALAREAGEREFFYYPTESAQSSFFIVSELDYLNKIRVCVKTVSLDLFCKENQIKKIDFLKIDTEGAELEVLLGAKDLLEHKKIQRIQFEYGYKYAAAGATLKKVYDLLQSCGYSVYRIAPNSLIRIDQWRDKLDKGHGYCNYLACLAEK